MTNKEIISSLRGLIGKYNLTDDEWQSIEHAIVALQHSRWIPVTEKLPNLMQDVLVSDGADTFIGWYNTEFKRWVSSSALYNSKEYPLKAWMPLPQPYKAESEEQGMNEQMEFPETFEKFAKEYGFKDDKEVYTNGSDLIQIFRVKQWLEHDNKLRKIETDTAYECGKHANKWIPVSERLPEEYEDVLVCTDAEEVFIAELYMCEGEIYFDDNNGMFIEGNIVAWMPLAKPYKAGSEK